MVVVGELSVEALPFIRLQERFDTSFIKKKAWLTVPITIHIALSPTGVIKNTRDDIKNWGAGQYGFSYESNANSVFTYNFALDFSPSIPHSLLTDQELRVKKGSFLISWDLLVQTTGVGIMVHCRASVGNKVDVSKKISKVVDIFFADLIDINEYTSDASTAQASPSAASSRSSSASSINALPTSSNSRNPLPASSRPVSPEQSPAASSPASPEQSPNPEPSPDPEQGPEPEQSPDPEPRTKKRRLITYSNRDK